METIAFDELSTLEVPSAALRSSLGKIASALAKVGTAGTDARTAVDEPARGCGPKREERPHAGKI